MILRLHMCAVCDLTRDSSVVLSNSVFPSRVNGGGTGGGSSTRKH